MFTGFPCEDRKVESAVVARTLTGTSKEKIICEVGHASDIKHFASVRNLRAYETRVKCTANIPDPRLLQFRLPGSDENTNTWSRETTLRSYGEYNFPPVPVRSDFPNGGDQIIKVELEIDRLRARGTSESISLIITVSA